MMLDLDQDNMLMMLHALQMLTPLLLNSEHLLITDYFYKPAIGTKYTNADQTDTQPTTAAASNQSCLSIFIPHRKHTCRNKA